MNALRLPVTLFCFPILILLTLQGCSAEPVDNALDAASYHSVDVPYGGQALVVMVNVVPASTSTRAVESPGDSVSGIYLETLEGISGYTDSSGTAVLTGIANDFTRLRLEAGDEAGEVGVQLDPGGLTEVAISLREDGAYLLSQLSWSGSQVTTLTPDVSGGIPLVSIDADDQVVVVPSDVYEADLEIQGDNVRVYGEGFDSSWPTIAGAVRIYGDNVQLRGVWLEGELEVDGDRFAMSFGGIEQGATVAGDNATFLDTLTCSAFKATGSNVLVARSDILPIPASCP